MLVARLFPTSNTMVGRAQSGMVMMFALIILVLMALGGLALIRSMDTSNMIAGNMAFQQAAINSADAGIESANAWLQTNNAVPGTLNNSIPAAGYTASTPNIAANQTGEAFWNALSASGICWLPVAGGACSTVAGAPTGVPDAAGNTVAYMIQRLCNGTGSPAGAGCAVMPGTGTTQGNDEGAGEELLVTPSQSLYYRITVRVTGPRNTVSFVQAVVSM